MNDWRIVYEQAIRRDGSLFFPERLNHEFLERAKKTMGTWLFANQYQNEIIPDGNQPFKKEWLKYYTKLPERFHTFAFIDPAISQSAGADFTALVVIYVDADQNWYLKTAQRFKITPPQIINLIFRVQNEFNCSIIGIEDVAYQRALLYMLDEEMRRRGVYLPVKGIKPTTDKTKETRILGLVPRFEWGRITLAQGLSDFELEYAQFPRGRHDDLLDAAAYLETIVYYPAKERTSDDEPSSPNDPAYEKWYRTQLTKRSQEQPVDGGWDTGSGDDY